MATKVEILRDIILSYEHDWDAEGRISKRRLWYILKPKFAALPSYVITPGGETIFNSDSAFWSFIETEEKAKRKPLIFLKDMFHKGQPVQTVNAKNLNGEYNELAKLGLIDDTYILDNSRVLKVGTLLPKIILVAEKNAIDEVALTLASDLGISCYIARGFSSIYAAKKLLNEINEKLDFTPYEITDEILDADMWTETYQPEPEDTDIILLNISDYDKAGGEIVDTVCTHFAADKNNNHKVVLSPSQVPETKVDEYFKITAELGKNYELDVLNRHQLRDTFLESIPQHVSEMIINKRQTDTILDYRDTAIPIAVDLDPEVKTMAEVVAELGEEKAEIESEYLEQIRALEDAMAEATTLVDVELEEAESNLDDKKREVFPKYVKAFDSFDVLDFTQTTIENIANGISTRYKVNYDWTK